MSQTVSIAIGIVMHRHSLSRKDALTRLRQQADQAGTSLDAVSERILTAQEVLSGLGSL
nr:ANTAR domain-containing protein [Aquabacterium fontiphilum]